MDPATQKPLLVKDGRFGMYVTDGETNATLRRGDTVEALTLERGLELLAGRRAWEAENGGASRPKKSSRKKAAAAPKETTAKASTAKARAPRASKSAPTLTKNTIKKGTAKKPAKKTATGKAKVKADE